MLDQTFIIMTASNTSSFPNIAHSNFSSGTEVTDLSAPQWCIILTYLPHPPPRS